MKKIILIIILLSASLFGNFIGMNNGARSLAMGNAFVALSDETTAIFYNPAGLARINQFNIAASSYAKNVSISNPGLFRGLIAINFHCILAN